MICYALNYKGKRNVIKKNLAIHDNIQYNYINSTDLKNPVIRVTYSDELNLQLFKYNYIVLNPDSESLGFGKRKRCYFVDMGRTRNIAKGIWEVGLTLDELTTYQAEILDSTANILRNSEEYDMYIKDNCYQSLAYPRVGTIKFGAGFANDYTYLLTVANQV